MDAFASLTYDQVHELRLFLTGVVDAPTTTPKGRGTGSQNREPVDESLWSEEEDHSSTDSVLDRDAAEAPVNVSSWQHWGTSGDGGGDGTGDNVSDDDERHSPPARVKRDSRSQRGSQGSLERENAKWLHRAVVSVTCGLDALALAYSSRLVVLERSETTGQFTVGFQRDILVTDAQVTAKIARLAEDEKDWTEHFEVCSVLLLQMQSTLKSEPKPYEWTCVAVGLACGTVNFYTEKGKLIFCENFSTTPVKDLRLGRGPQGAQEFAVLCDDSLTLVDGLGLYNALRVCKNQVARGQGVCNLYELVNLDYKKFRNKHDTMRNSTGVAVTGPAAVTTFDQYHNACTHGGFYEKVFRTSLPVYYTYLLPGDPKYVAFGWHEEGGGAAVLSDALYSFADKMKSQTLGFFNVPSFLGGSTNAGANEKPKMIPADVRGVELLIRSSLIDVGRAAQNYYLAPGGRLCAICDTKARIALIDVQKRTLVRMWKGYRDAMCAWIEVNGEMSLPTSQQQQHRESPDKRQTVSVLFLVIFAPRRKLLEIWACRSGPRVLAYSVDRRGRLLWTCRSEEGLLGSVSGSQRAGPSSAYFMQSDGKIKRITVPFHLAFRDESAIATHDDALVRSALEALSSCKSDNKMSQEQQRQLETKLLGYIKEMKSAGARRRVIDAALETAVLPISLIARILDGTAASVQSGKTQSVEACNLVARLRAHSQLANVYAVLVRLHTEQQVVVGKKKLDTNTIAGSLKLDEAELVRVLALLERCSLVRRTVAVPVRGDRTTGRKSGEESKSDNILKAGAAGAADRNTDSNQQQRQQQQERQQQNQQEQQHLHDRHAPMSFYAMLNCLSISFSEDVSATGRLTYGFHSKIEHYLPALGRLLFEPVLLGYCSLKSAMTEIFPQLQVDPTHLFRLLLVFWLDCECHTKSFLLTDVLDLVASLVDTITGTDPSIDWLRTPQQLIMASDNISEALSLCLIIRAVAHAVQEARTEMMDLSGAGCEEKVGQKQQEGDEEVGEVGKSGTKEGPTTSAWVPVQIRLEKWDLILMHLRAVALLNALPDGQQQQQRDNSCSLDDLVAKGAGCYRESVGAWAANSCNRIAPSDFIPAMNRVRMKNDAKDNDWFDLLADLRQTFPMSFTADTIFCNCAWECAVQWNRHPDNVAMLEHCSEYLLAVDNVLLRHGICSLIWDKLLQPRFRALFHLVEKVGKFPKDRLSHKEVGVSETHLVRFATACRKFLQLAYDTAGNKEHSPFPVLKYEDFLDQLFNIHNHDGDGLQKRGEPLCEVATKQKTMNAHLVRHHVHLALAVELQLIFALKLRPGGYLFDDKGRRAFFQPFTSHPYVMLTDVDDAVRTGRQRFVNNCVKAAVEHSRTGAATDGTNNAMAPFVDSCNLVVELANEWQLDTDSLRCEQVLALYANGRDVEAEQLTHTIGTPSALSEGLLKLLGARFTYQLRSACGGGSITEALSTAHKQSLIGTRTVDFLQNLSDERHPFSEDLVTKASLSRLMKQVEHCLQGDPKTSDMVWGVFRDLQKLISAL